MIHTTSTSTLFLTLFSTLHLLSSLTETRAAITLSLSETHVTRQRPQPQAQPQPVLKGQADNIVAAAGAPADTTGADAWVGLQNEGTVLTANVGIGLGSGGGTYKMVIDSGSPIFWVASPSCSGCVIDSSVQRYTANTTQSYRTAPYQREVMEYAIGDISGNYGTETFSLGDDSVANVTFATVDEARTWLFKTEENDVVGILPLGHGALRVQDLDGQTVEVPTPLQALFQSGSIDSPVCGVSMAQGNPQLTIGGVDQSLAWNEAGKVVLPSVTEEYHYTVPLENAQTWGTNTLSFPNHTVIFDTAASHIFAPSETIASIYQSLGSQWFNNLYVDNNATFWAVPCQKPEGFSFSFGFGGKQFPVAYEALVNAEMPLESYVNGVKNQLFNENKAWCHGNLQDTSMFGLDWDKTGSRWLMGLTFLRSVYSSFNFDNGEVTLWPLENYETNSKSVETNITTTANTTQEAQMPVQTNGTYPVANETSLGSNETSYVAYQPTSLELQGSATSQMTANETSYVAFQPTTLVVTVASQVTANYTEVTAQPSTDLVITSFGIGGAIQTLTITAAVPTATVTSAIGNTANGTTFDSNVFPTGNATVVESGIVTNYPTVNDTTSTYPTTTTAQWKRRRGQSGRWHG